MSVKEQLFIKIKGFIGHNQPKQESSNKHSVNDVKLTYSQAFIRNNLSDDELEKVLSESK